MIHTHTHTQREELKKTTNKTHKIKHSKKETDTKHDRQLETLNQIFYHYLKFFFKCQKKMVGWMICGNDNFLNFYVYKKKAAKFEKKSTH